MSSIKILILYKIFLSKTTLFFYLKIYRSKWFKLFYLELKIYNFAIKNWNKRKNINNPLIIYELSDEQIIKYSNFIRKTSIYTKEDLKILFSKLESILKNEENIILMYQIEELVYKILFKDEFQNFKSFYKHINKIQDYEKINNNIYFIK
nr:hypothetical protein [Mycoplasma leonicaptivi]